MSEFGKVLKKEWHYQRDRLVKMFKGIPQWYRQFRAKRSRWAMAGLIGGGLVVVGILSALVLFCLVYFEALGPMPTYAELQNIRHNNASEVYAEDGVLLGKYYVENRINADFEEISPDLINALVATEDARFFEHSGVDMRAAARVVVKSILLQDESAGGGSTLSQQLAKNLYPRESYWMLSLPINKLREMIIARRLERTYKKEELLNLYLNTVPFSENVYGVKVAAQRFFNTSPKELKAEQAAVLVGMLKGTHIYNPKRYPERALERRNTVLSQMKKYGYLDAVAYDSLSQKPIDLDYYQEGNNAGLATYFREHLRLQLERELEGITKPDGTPYNIYTDGLKIHTTLNAKMQQYAEEAVATQMQKLQKDFDRHWKGRKPWGSDQQLERLKQASTRYQVLQRQGLSEVEIDTIFNRPIKMNVFSWTGEEEERELSPLDSIKYYTALLHAGFLAVEPATGKIRAWVGGINHKYFQYDHVKSTRQVGSTFKPIVYAKALQSGIPPCDYFENSLTAYPEYDNWQPQNSDGEYGGLYSMAGGLSNSVNTITVEVLLQSGVEPVRQLAKQMGISTDVPAVPSIALGTVEASLYDMVRVYSTFANRGVRPELTYLTRVENSAGETILSFEAPKPQQFQRVLAIDEADMMIKMLETVVDSGTARRLRYEFGLYGDVAGKTGTTQNQSDGWFMGFTPNLVAGAWVGAESPRVHFRSLYLGQGSNTALPIFGHFMRKIYRDKAFKDIRYARFAEPSEETMLAMECPTFLPDSLFAFSEIDEQRDGLLNGLFDQLFQKGGREIGINPNDGIQQDEAQRLHRIQQREENLEEKRAERKAFWNKLLFGKDKNEDKEDDENDGRREDSDG